jgi:hypothetical protein
LVWQSRLRQHALAAARKCRKPRTARRNWTDLDGVTEAQAHYRGPICVRCFEDFATCAHCGNKRREQDMWSYTGPVCSSVCDLSLEYDNTNADNRLTRVDYGL